jgi:hypothetical protein
MSWIRKAPGQYEKRPEIKDCYEILRRQEEYEACLFKGFNKLPSLYHTVAEIEAWIAKFCSCAPGLKDKSRLLHPYQCRAMRKIAKLGDEE